MRLCLFAVDSVDVIIEGSAADICIFSALCSSVKGYGITNFTTSDNNGVNWCQVWYVCCHAVYQIRSLIVYVLGRIHHQTKLWRVTTQA
jgi:hypothetical protein